MRIFTGFVLLVLTGCTGDLVELGVGNKQDLSFGNWTWPKPAREMG